MNLRLIRYISVIALFFAALTYSPLMQKEVSAEVADPTDPGWELDWSDDFNGFDLNEDIWDYEIGNGVNGWGNDEWQYYTDRTENVYVSGGTLKIIARQEEKMYQKFSFTSARIHTKNKKFFKYGKMEARIKILNGNQYGVWPAFWMMGNVNDAWPACGEINIMEHKNLDNTIYGTLHWGASNYHHYWGSEISHQYYTFSDNTNNGITAWHTYGVTWDDRSIKWYVDDNVYQTKEFTSANRQFFQRNYYFLLDVALGGANTQFTEGKTPNHNPGGFKKTIMYVDYVRAYSYHEPPETIETPEATDDNFVISSKTLNLNSGISLIFKVKEELFEDNYTDPKVVVDFNGKKTEITECTSDGNGKLLFEFDDIIPAEMNDTLSVTLHAWKNGRESVSPSVDYSVATYCYNMLKKYPDLIKLRTLLVDLLNYGAASQIYVNWNTDNLVNMNLTPEQQSWASDSPDSLTSVKNNAYRTIKRPSVFWKASGLILVDSVVVRMRFEAEDIEGLIVRVADDYDSEWEITEEDFEPVPGQTNQYYVYFKGFNVGRMSDNMYFMIHNGSRVVSNTYRYSVESYACIHENDGNALGPLVVAMIKYGNSAKAYNS